VLVDATGVFKQHKEWRIRTRTRRKGGLYFGRGGILGVGGEERGHNNLNFRKIVWIFFFVVYFVFFWTYLCSFEPV
jgi:hypothetical protein